MKFEGNELVVRSERKELDKLIDTRLKDYNNSDDKDPNEKDALSKLKRLEKQHQSTLKAYKKKQKEKYSANVTPEYKKLVSIMVRMKTSLNVIGIDISETTVAPTNVVYTESSGRAYKVMAKPLTKTPGNTKGSSPGSSVPVGWEKIDPKERSKHWVRAHMLNHHLHGPGETWNLFPAHKQVNSDMEAKIEAPAKNAIDKFGHKKYYFYYAKLTYGNGDFPTNLDMKFGTYDPEKKKEIKVTHEYPKVLPQPNISYTVNINTDSATRLQEVAKINNVNGLSNFFTNLVKERKANGAFDDLADIRDRLSSESKVKEKVRALGKMIRDKQIDEI